MIIRRTTTMVFIVTTRCIILRSMWNPLPVLFSCRPKGRRGAPIVGAVAEYAKSATTM